MSNDIDALKQRVREILQQHPGGIAENHLLKQVRASTTEPANPDPGNRLYQLFYEHFRLFHVLYQLQDELFQKEQGCLSISPLHIEIQPFDQARGQELAEHDGLRAFYADISNLEKIDAAQLAQWLGKFWAGVPANERRKQALATLGLQDPVDDKLIKEQYRRLAMRHHPDRGGDEKTLQSINLAMQILSGQA